MTKKLFLMAFVPSLLVAEDNQRFDVIQQSPQAVCNFMPDLLKEIPGATPETTIVVCDLDGVVTTNDRGDSQTPTARKDMPAFLKTLQQSGFKTVISSAWGDFSQTSQKIKHLGLENAFLTGSEGQGSLTVGQTNIFYEQNGLSVSCKQDESAALFRQKAFAPYVAFGADATDEAKWVIFLDDSEENIKQFQTDVTTYNLYPNASKVTLFHLNRLYRQDRSLNLSAFQEAFPSLLEGMAAPEETAPTSGKVSPLKRSVSGFKEPSPKRSCGSDLSSSRELLGTSSDFLRTSQRSLKASG